MIIPQLKIHNNLNKNKVRRKINNKFISTKMN